LTIIDKAIDEWSGVDVFAHVCGQTADTSSSSAIVTIFSYMTRGVLVFVKFDTILDYFFVY